MRPASHSSCSRQSTSWMSPSDSWTPSTVLRSRHRSDASSGAAEAFRRPAPVRSASEASRPNRTKRTSSTAVSAPRTAAIATGRGLVERIPVHAGRDRREGDRAGAQLVGDAQRLRVAARRAGPRDPLHSRTPDRRCGSPTERGGRRPSSPPPRPVGRPSGQRPRGSSCTPRGSRGRRGGGSRRRRRRRPAASSSPRSRSRRPAASVMSPSTQNDPRHADYRRSMIVCLAANPSVDRLFEVERLVEGRHPPALGLRAGRGRQGIERRAGGPLARRRRVRRRAAPWTQRTVAAGGARRRRRRGRVRVDARGEPLVVVGGRSGDRRAHGVLRARRRRAGRRLGRTDPRDDIPMGGGELAHDLWLDASGRAGRGIPRSDRGGAAGGRARRAGLRGRAAAHRPRRHSPRSSS